MTGQKPGSRRPVALKSTSRQGLSKSNNLLSQHCTIVPDTSEDESTLVNESLSESLSG